MGTRGGISRERFFFYAWLCGLLWYFVPGYLFQALSYFSWVCWIAPDNIVVNQMFGYASGMGMSMITFDWSQISYIGRSFEQSPHPGFCTNCYITGSPLGELNIISQESTRLTIPRLSRKQRHVRAIFLPFNIGLTEYVQGGLRQILLLDSYSSSVSIPDSERTSPAEGM